MDLILPSSPPHHPQIPDDLMVASHIPLRVSHHKSEEEEPEENVGDIAPSRRKRKNEKAKNKLTPL
jgi:hypothetical protein